MTQHLCLIPARGGSKGIPRKNIRPTAGKPLIQWTIEQARNTQGDLRVVVSTEDDEIASVAEACGADVPFRRPSTLAADGTTTEAVVLHALGELESGGYRPDAVVLLQATSPVRRPDTIARAIEQFESEQPDSMVGVVAQAPFLWHRTDPPSASYDVGHRPMRQDLTDRELVYREIGSIYVTRTEIWERQRNRLGGNVSLFVMDEMEGIDIDTPFDHQVAEVALRELEARR